MASITGTITLNYPDSISYNAALSDLQSRQNGTTITNVSGNATNLTVTVTLTNYSG